MQPTEAIVTVLVTGMLFGIPLLGLTLRFSLKPLVEAYVRLREAHLASPNTSRLEARIAYLEHVLENHGIAAPLPSYVAPLAEGQTPAITALPLRKG